MKRTVSESIWTDLIVLNNLPLLLQKINEDRRLSKSKIINYFKRMVIAKEYSKQLTNE